LRRRIAEQAKFLGVITARISASGQNFRVLRVTVKNFVCKKTYAPHTEALKLFIAKIIPKTRQNSGHAAIESYN
jgi:cellulase/cellobiase CelA1